MIIFSEQDLGPDHGGRNEVPSGAGQRQGARAAPVIWHAVQRNIFKYLQLRKIYFL